MSEQAGTSSTRDGHVLPPLVVIAGATATGKTALSLALADALGDAEIVSADSRQVYRGMDVGTAKATAEERARVPHHGLDLVDPDERFTLADYQRHALHALREIGARRRTALLVGGTGLYLRAIARGFRIGTAPPDRAFRGEMERLLAERGASAVAAELERLAPEVAMRTDLANPRRVIRAMERVRAGSDPPTAKGYPAPVTWLGVRLDPPEHRLRIEARARAQFEGGLLDEAERLAERYARDLPAFSAFGYREAMAVLDGELTTDAAVERTAKRTWRYAGRQRTWFRAEPDIEWLDADGARLRDAALARVRLFLERPTRARGPRAPR